MAKILDTCFRKTRLASTDRIAFDLDLLNLLVAIEETKTLREVAEEVRMAPAVFKECLQKLVRFKMVEPVLDSGPLIGPALLSRIREVLVELTGPLGEVLVEDAAHAMNLKVSGVPVSRAKEFIAAIAEEIPAEKQREIFLATIDRELQKDGG